MAQARTYACAKLSALIDPSVVMSCLVRDGGAGCLALDATAAGRSLLVLILLKLGLLIVAAPFLRQAEDCGCLRSGS
jgi:hypothetical protein